MHPALDPPHYDQLCRVPLHIVVSIRTALIAAAVTCKIDVSEEVACGGAPDFCSKARKAGESGRDVIQT